MSTDGGASFGSIVNLSNNGGSSFQPAIAASINNVYVAWFDNTSGDSKIFYKKVQIVESPSEVSLICAMIRIIQSPAVDVSGNNVSVVWLDNTAGNFEILLRALM
jgi:hypothetical protein